MLEWSEYAKFFIGLFAVLNPLGVIPIFIGLTASHPSLDRVKTGTSAAWTCGAVLVVSLLVGNLILAFLGISLASFRVGGGILILLMALSMLHAKTSPAKQTSTEAREANEKESIGVVPLGIPLLAGPGSISTVIVFAGRTDAWLHKLVLCGGVVILALIVWLILRSGPLIAKMLGGIGINIATRIMGLTMAALGVEFIASGVKILLPGLA